MDSPRGNVLATYPFWLGSSLIASVLLVNFAPHYSVHKSYPWTAAVLFLCQWIIYGVYTVVIYPRFISPLRHLPQPKVRLAFSSKWPPYANTFRVIRSSMDNGQQSQENRLVFRSGNGPTRSPTMVSFDICEYLPCL